MNHITSLALLARNAKRAAVIGYTPSTLAAAVTMGLFGVRIEIFSAPSGAAGEIGPGFTSQQLSLADYLALHPTMFNETAYLECNPDVAEAVRHGDLGSGYEHYIIFGQAEGRALGFTYSSGLSTFDILIVDGQLWDETRRLVDGALQAHHRLIICHDCDEAIPTLPIPNELLPGHYIFYVPPKSMRGPVKPVGDCTKFSNWPRIRSGDIFPSRHSSGDPWPRISIVTPSYNQASFLETTIQSVLKQGYPNLEFIVIDGGSTDGSVEIIERYADRLTHWESGPDRGQSHALNKGFSRATGSLLTWLNSDDQLAPGALFTVAEAFIRHQPDLVVGRCARIMHPSFIPYHFHRCRLPLNVVQPLLEDKLLELDDCWMTGHFFHQPEVFFTKDIWTRSGGHVREDLYYSMDYELWLRFARAGSTIFAIPDVLAIFRQHSNQKTGGEELPFLPELRRVNQEYLTSRELPIAPTKSTV
jgi:GT2 family glycosyltransferase